MLGIDRKSIKLGLTKGIDLRLARPKAPEGRYFLRLGNLFPEKTKDGRVRRSRVVWWLNTGELPGDDFIHHKDENKANDRFSNLERQSPSDHTRHHSSTGITYTERRCRNCRKKFLIERRKLCELTRGRYCSRNCYLKRKISKTTRQKLAAVGTGRRHSSATIDKMRKAHKKRWRKRKGLE